VERAVQIIGAHDRNQFLDRVIVDEMRLQSPRQGVTHFALQFFGALFRGGDFDAADLEECRHARVRGDFFVSCDRPLRQPADGVGIVVLEHQPGRVRG